MCRLCLPRRSLLLAACVLWPLIAAQSTVPADLCPVVNTALSKLPACTASASCERSVLHHCAAQVCV